jgi:membrane-bound ClpP family serine protease
VGAIGLGFGGTLSLVCAGLALFGVAMVRCGVHPRLPGLLLVSGGAVLLVAQAFAPGFGRAVSGTSPAWGVLMGLALVAVAGALADLDVLHRESAAHAHR